MADYLSEYPMRVNCTKGIADGILFSFSVVSQFSFDNATNGHRWTRIAYSFVFFRVHLWPNFQTITLLSFRPFSVLPLLSGNDCCLVCIQD
jgi:hypothetical protein